MPDGRHPGSEGHHGEPVGRNPGKRGRDQLQNPDEHRGSPAGDGHQRGTGESVRHSDKPEVFREDPECATLQGILLGRRLRGIETQARIALHRREDTQKPEDLRDLADA